MDLQRESSTGYGTTSGDMVFATIGGITMATIVAGIMSGTMVLHTLSLWFRATIVPIATTAVEIIPATIVGKKNQGWDAK